MRGPGVRLDLDVRRVWRCPKCQRERRLSGEFTAVRCTCPDAAWMQIVAERVAVQRPVTSMEARELTVASFNLSEEEMATPLPGRVRRRGPNLRGDGPPGEAPATNEPAVPERGSKNSRAPGGNEPPSGPPGRKPRPPRPPKVAKRPLSDIASFPDGPSSPPEEKIERSPPESVSGPDDFSAGIDLPPSPPQS